MTTSLSRPLVTPRPASTRTTSLRERMVGSLAVRRTLLAVGLAAAGALLIHNLLSGVGHVGILDWDEARHGVSAYEMLQSGDFLVNTYRGAPDYWNLKPPISFWAIAASFKVFGYTALALRIPSIAATVLTTALVTAFTYKRLGGVAAVVAASFLASSSQFLMQHAGRTGDPDALFILFMTASVLCTVSAARNPKLLLASTTFFSLAFLTKSFHAALALVFMPVAIAMMPRALRPPKRVVALSLIGFVPLLAWVLARMQYDGTQFLSQMVSYDLLSRGSTVIEGHTGPPESYVQQLRAASGPWLLAAFGASTALLAGRSFLSVRTAARSPRGQTLMGAASWCVLVLAAFSAASSKLPWYTTPAMPLLAVLIGGLCGLAIARLRLVARSVLVGALALALALTQFDLRDLRSVEIGVPMQVLLAQLHRSPHYEGQNIYLDAAANYSDTNTAWSQSMTLAAELGGGLVPQDGGLTAIEQARGPALMFVQRGSATEVELEKSGSVREIVSDSASRIVEWTKRTP